MGTAAGEGRARVERVAGRSVVTACYAGSPMKLLTPRAPGAPAGAAATVCVSGFGGGIVSGDHLALELEVGIGARAVLTTQASTKVFHADAAGTPARQSLAARVEAGATLAVVPDPVVCFRDAVYEQGQRFELAGDAGLVLLDGFTSGRAEYGAGERWAFRRFATRNRVSVGGVEVLHDALVLDGATAADPLVTGGFGCFANLFFVGAAADHAGVEAFLATVRGRRPRRGDAVRPSAGRLEGRPVAAARFAGPRVEAVEAELRVALACLPDLVGAGYGERKF